ncbi:MAG TPA: AAA family ATPase [Clostridia bacterium]|nr:AAA family ATPase [Clostridia bacterium]
MGKIIAIANQKGGVAKTTTAVNLGASLSQLGQSVLLVDIDPQGNATTGLGFDKQQIERCIYDALINEVRVEDLVLSIENFTDFDLIPATLQLAGGEIELVNQEAREHVLRKALGDLKDNYNYIFIDCPPSLGLLTLNALTAADSVLIPIQCEYYALEGLGQLMNTVKIVQERLNPELAIEGVLCTMFDARTNLAIQVVDEVKKYFRDKVYSSIVPRNVRLSEAPSHGRPVALYDARCRGAQVYMDLAKEVMGIE